MPTHVSNISRNVFYEIAKLTSIDTYIHINRDVVLPFISSKSTKAHKVLGYRLWYSAIKNSVH